MTFQVNIPVELIQAASPEEKSAFDSQQQQNFFERAQEILQMPNHENPASQQHQERQFSSTHLAPSSRSRMMTNLSQIVSPANIADP